VDNVIYRDEAYKIVGCCMEVYNTIGAGFLEEVYHAALEREFKAAGIPYGHEVPLDVLYKGETLNKRYFADFVCYGRIIVELKAVSELCDAHCAQVTNYLKATGYQLGILVNFGNTERLQYVRRVNTQKPLAQIRTIGEDSRSGASGVIQSANEREFSE